jgi:predicted exporter
MTERRRRGFIAAWWLVLLGMLLLLQRSLVVSGDLRSFMPPPTNAEQKLLLDEIGEGPASRLLLLAIGNAPPAQLVALSKTLAASLRGNTLFERVLNGGETDVSALDPALLPYRYVLSPTLDTQRFDADYLRSQLQQRAEDLGSPASELLKEWLPRDPTLEVLKLAQRWTPLHVPPQRGGVWYSTRGDEALLLVQTRAAGFDPQQQAAAVAGLQAAFATLPERGPARLTVSGPGYIGVQVGAATRTEAEWLGALGAGGFALLLLLGYRSFGVLALVALPLLSGAVAGVAAIVFAFGSIHGITLAFGFTLLGVAQEYPLRVFSHRRVDADARRSVQEIWPLLRLAIVSACIAYLAFIAAGVPGLQQLAIFTIAGLLAAGAATRWLLPPLLSEPLHDVADFPWLERLRRGIAAIPRPRWLPWLVLAAGLGMLWLARAPLWQNDLAALTPAPPALLQREAQLREALGAPDLRYVLVLEAATADAVLQLAERISPQVDKWISAGAVDDVELPSRYLPSLETQRDRQHNLPDYATLSAALATAVVASDFQPGLFEPFLDDVETARGLPLLTPERFELSPFGVRLQSLLVQRDGRWFGIGVLSGVHDAAKIAATPANVRLLDLKSATEALIVQYRTRILLALGAALLLLALTVAIAFGDLRRAWHVIAPMSLATLLVLAVLRAAGIPLSLFHLVALTLAAGLGLHYALFFERRAPDAAEARRTLHATLMCVSSAVLVFGLLATSSLPVLRAIGLTVALGVAFHFCLSIQMAQPHGEN